MNTYTLASRVIEGVAYTLERLLPGHPEGDYRLREGLPEDGSYRIVKEPQVEEELMCFFGMGRMQAKAAIRRARQWAKEVQYEFFPSSPGANS